MPSAVTQIDFYFNARDKLAYTCHLLHEVLPTTPSVVVTGDAQQLAALDTLWHQQHTRFSEQQKCLFIPADWLGRIEASLQDVRAQIQQALQC